MLKRTISFVLVLVLTLSLFSIASTSFSAVDSVAEVKPESVDVTNGKFPIFEGYHTVVYKDLVYMQSAYISAWRYGEYVTEYWDNMWPGVKMQYAYTDENRNKIYVAYVPDNYTFYLINNGSAKTEIYKLQDNVGIYVDGVTMPYGYWTLDTWQPEFYIYGEENTTPTEPTTSPEASTNSPEPPTSTTSTIPAETIATEPTEGTTTPTKTEPTIPTETIATDPVEKTTAPVETEPTEELSATIYTFKYSDHKYKVFADVTGGTGTYEYQFAVNGTIHQSFSTQDYIICVFPSDGSYTIEATIKDSAGETISTTTALYIESTPTSEPTTDPIETEPLDPDTLEISETEGADKSEGLGYIFGYLGDVDLTDTVNIKDATTIQKHVASLLNLKDSNITLADVDFSGAVNVKDATTIQKWIAGIAVDAPVYHLLYAPFNTSKHIHAYKFSSVAPTCTEKGYVEYICACGESYKDNWADAKHNYTAKTTPPTCTENGYTVFTCKCGDSYTANVVIATGHTYTSKVIVPTCTENGYTVFTCKCGDSYTGNVVIATGHSYTSKVVVPTCKDKGYTEYTCACGDTYIDNWTNTISTHSYKNGVCTICGADEPHTHSYSTKVIAPTCKDKGYTLHICSCGDEYKDSWVNITSTHSYKNGVCSICGADEPHTHSYSTKVVAPTCKDKGYTLHKCSCGDEYKDTWTEPQHKFSNSYCTKCKISSYDYLVSWIKTHGKLNNTDGYYSYEFNTSNAPNGISDFSFSIEYYYDLDEITLFLHDSSTMTGTMVTIFSDTLEDYFVQCICSSQTFDIRSVIGFLADSHIMTSPIYVSYYESDTIPLDDIIDITKIYAHYTIAVSDYCLKSTNVGVTMSDFGFTKEYSSLEGEMPFDKDHVHTYKKIDDSHTATEPGIATFTCSCGSEYWTESSHTFESYQCTECGITPFDYYANWIKDNGTVNGDRYEYTFTSIYNIDNTEDLSVNVYYYPILDSEPCIALHLYDSYFNETTMIFLYEDDAIAYCGSTNGDYTIYTEIDITEYTDNTPIQPDSDSWYNSNSEIEYTRQNINLTLSAHGYTMLSEVDGLSLYDLGFYSY